MQVFSLAKVIHEELEKQGFGCCGVSYAPLHISFHEDTLMIDRSNMMILAQAMVDSEASLKAEWEAKQTAVITPEKVQPLVDLLISKGILTQQEVDALGTV